MKKLIVIAILAAVSMPLSHAGKNKYVEASRQPEIVSQWNGAKVAYLGDSITDERQYPGQEVYWSLLKNILGIEPYVYGISGHQTRHIKGQAEKLLSEHGQNVDAIFIFIGTNDYNSCVPLGQWYTERLDTANFNGRLCACKRREPVMDANTMRSSINSFMSYLKENYPTKQIILLTPIHRGFFAHSDTNVQPDEFHTNRAGLYIDDYIEVIRETASVWAVPVIDLCSISGLYPMAEAQVQYFRNRDRDKLHPNTEGHRRIAYALAYQLLGYPAKF